MRRAHLVFYFHLIKPTQYIPRRSYKLAAHRTSCQRSTTYIPQYEAYGEHYRQHIETLSGGKRLAAFSAQILAGAIPIVSRLTGYKAPRLAFAVSLQQTAVLAAAPFVRGVVVERQASTISTVPSWMWTTLNATVGGRLGRGQPFSKPCYTKYNGVTVALDDTECQARLDNVQEERYRLGVFGSAMNTQWESCATEASYCRIDALNSTNRAPFENSECGQGSIAPYYIAIKNATDVTAAFMFSQVTGVPLTIKNTGHDYLGRSHGKDTLSIWTHNLQDITRKQNFVAEQCDASTATDAVSLGAGVHWEKVYQWAEAQHVTVLGGACPTVGGAGGWVQGGGHGALSNTYGLGVDRVLQFKVVTPDGKLRIANKCQNQDLFWAMRGGGGGTWGVALETTYKLEPQVTLQVYSVTFVHNATPERIRAFTKVLVDHSVRLAEEGWGGYIQPYGMQFANPKLNLTQAQASIKPLIDFFATLGNIVEGPNNVFTLDSFYPFERDIASPWVDVGPGLIGATGGRFIHKANFATAKDKEELLEAMLQVYEKSDFVAVMAATPYSYPAEAGATSVHPGWRTAVWSVVTVGLPWQWNIDAAGIKAKYDGVTQVGNILRAITPFEDAGVYINESDVYEPDWQKAYFGSNYNKLLEIKQKYDPKGLLDCWHCVGWKGKANSRYKCYV